MSTTGRRIPVRQESVSNRMTPEMCKAIRRQEKNAGFDYWKAGFPGLGSTGPPADRRPGLQNLSQINLTFPGLFLPNVDGAINKPRRRDSIAGLPANSAPTLTLRRSNSMISSVPSSRRIPVQTVSSSNKTSKRDLTCSQLTDSLLSYTNASFPNIGLFRSTTNRPRASDYLWEDLTPESEGLSQSEQNADDDDDDVPTYHTMLADDCEEFSEIETVKSPVELNHIYNPTFPVRNRKPYKSILKNSNSSDSALPGRNLNGPQSAKMPTVCSYQLPSPRSGAVSSATLYRPSGNVVTDSFRPRMHNGYMYNSVRRQQSASARVVPVDCDNHLADLVSDVATRKRCVRFNVAHQIHEYRPFDPIINC